MQAFMAASNCSPVASSANSLTISRFVLSSSSSLPVIAPSPLASDASGAIALIAIWNCLMPETQPPVKTCHARNMH